MSTKYDDLADLAEAGQLLPEPDAVALRGREAAAAGQRALMNATGASTADEAVAIALGRPRLDAETEGSVTWKVRSTAGLDEAVRRAAEARGINRSRFIREAVAAYVRTAESNVASPTQS